MALADTRTRQTELAVEDFLGTIGDAGKRADSETLVAMMHRLIGEPARMWGPSIVGFGSYRYRYESGHSGESCIVGFSPRKAEFSIYLNGSFAHDVEPTRAALLARLGRHRMGKGCLYVKRLADIDAAVLEQLVALSVETIRRTWPQAAG